MRYGCVSDSHDYGTTREEMLEILEEAHNTCFVFEEVEGREISVDIAISPTYGKVPRFSRFPWLWYDLKEIDRTFSVRTADGVIGSTDAEFILGFAENMVTARIENSKKRFEEG